MKKLRCLLILLLLVCLAGCGQENQQAEKDGTEDLSQLLEVCDPHYDTNYDNVCDFCQMTLGVVVDFYSINDLHGKVADADTHPGVDELTTYIKEAREKEDHVILLSAGDMWQGSYESNLTQGLLMTEWMNEMDFVSMSMGNHEYDWGEEPILANNAVAEFPFLAINIYDRDTKQRVTYCDSSVMVDLKNIQIGIIGAIGDCYSSIAADKVEDVYFLTGNDLTNLVKEEADRLKAEGADYIVYVLHDGYGQSHNGSPMPVSGSKLKSYYDTSLSNGYVDLVFESHTHQGYILKDEYGVYHLQNRGDNQGGISHVEVQFDLTDTSCEVTEVNLVSTDSYQNLADDPIVETLMTKYEEDLAIAHEVLGVNSFKRGRNELRQIMAELYYEIGMKEWSEEYEIVLGGGFFSVRSPGYMPAGEVNYAMVQSLFPFDNQLVLCEVKGHILRDRFFESNNENYFIAYKEYGEEVYENIDPDGSYYIVVDTYSSAYGPNELTVVEEYDPDMFGRDMLAEYIRNGGLE